MDADTMVDIYRCKNCGELHFPRHYVCRICNTREFETIPLEGEGTLITWTRVYNLPEGYMKPYLGFGIIKYPNGLTITGQLDVAEPQTGMTLKTVIGVVKEGIGQDIYGPIFQ